MRRLATALICATIASLLLGVTGSDPPGTGLTSEVCNGFVNQRLSILYGLVAARKSGRALYLPDLKLNGRQFVATSTADQDNDVPFARFYDPQHFFAAMSPQVPVNLERAGMPRLSLRLATQDIQSLWLDVRLRTQHVQLECPLFKLSPDIMLQYPEVVNAWLTAFKPAPKLQKLVDKALYKLPPGRFNFLHWRAEEDWTKHCEVWKPDRPDNNCDTNTDAIGYVLASKEVETRLPLYVATDWGNVDSGRLENMMKQLQAFGYKIVTQQQIFGSALEGLEREERALLDYELALRAAKFMGNSVSTFSALLLLVREGWSSYYNGGDIPMAAVLPYYKIPWVFPYSTRTASYDYMVKMAVASAFSAGTLKPHCLFDGKPRGEMYRWLVEHNVTVMINSVKWASRMHNRKRSHFSHHSHLYSSPAQMIGTLQRIDIPIQPEMQQFNYVLYTDTDVIFTKPIYWTDFPLPFPTTVSMAYEHAGVLPCNAGVMLMNIPELKESHDALVEHAMANDDLYWHGYGPIDQGAINSFYNRSINGTCGLPSELNALMLLASTAGHQNKILHFMGPKLHQYATWARTGNCTFEVVFHLEGAKTLCELGVQRLCLHMPKLMERVMAVVHESDIDRQDLAALLGACTDYFEQMKPLPSPPISA